MADESRAARDLGGEAAKEGSGAAAHALVELVPTAAPVEAASGRYALVVGGARVEFGDDVSVTTLRRVLEVLRSC